MHWHRSTGKGIVIFAAGCVIGLIAAEPWTRMRPPSPLTAGLPGSWAAASATFDARVRARFPTGIPAQKLADDLAAEGFRPTWYEADGQYGAKRDESSFACNIAARIHWRVGKDGNVTAIQGLYREEGCL
jgi:hypothetical protein